MSDVFDLGSEHEQVVFANDPGTGLRAVIAIHSTALGPATGGLRMWTYENEQAAILDRVISVLDDPSLALLFGAGSRAEAPIVAELARPDGPPALFAGRIDRSGQ